MPGNCYELHPSEGLHDGVTFKMFLKRTGNHPRCNILYDHSRFVLQVTDTIGFIDVYHQRFRMVHVKDVESAPGRL